MGAVRPEDDANRRHGQSRPAGAPVNAWLRVDQLRSARGARSVARLSFIVVAVELLGRWTCTFDSAGMGEGAGVTVTVGAGVTVTAGMGVDIIGAVGCVSVAVPLGVTVVVVCA
jgi:hypothetical protein